MSAVVGTPTGYLQSACFLSDERTTSHLRETVVCLTWFFYDWVITADLEACRSLVHALPTHRTFSSSSYGFVHLVESRTQLRDTSQLRDWTFTKLLFLLVRDFSPRVHMHDPVVCPDAMDDGGIAAQ